MRIIKPRHLRKGDVIGICAPASPPSSTDALENGIEYIERLGYRVHLAKNIYRKRGYLAGTDAERAADVVELFSNKHVRAIFAARGGFGTQRILPLLDYRLARRNQKIVVGYSDITALQLALLAKTGLVSLSGPLVVEMPLRGASEELFWRALTSTKPLGRIRATDSRIFRDRANRSITAGTLVGGNLSLLSALLGSPYIPSVPNPILFLEEIDERPYRVDRTLQHLWLNGLLRRAKGLVLGSFVDCTPAKDKPSLTLQEVFKDMFSGRSIAVASGFHFGHVRNSLSMPIGLRARVGGMKNEVEILEALVS
ncbi:MAG TPA: LD-carboxypeptidase [Bacteroidota bacterium]|jgi:muramoyltetrapeptide carboxypeptidase|nr:LD-carboxypeptidase [Bacteroidota bacterium]